MYIKFTGISCCFDQTFGTSQPNNIFVVYIDIIYSCIRADFVKTSDGNFAGIYLSRTLKYNNKKREEKEEWKSGTHVVWYLCWYIGFNWNFNKIIICGF